jgi:hypothetical protein
MKKRSLKLTIDDYLEATQVYLPPSRIAEILQEHCNYRLLMQDYDIIFNKYNNYHDRLKELDNNFRAGKYTIGIEQIKYDLKQIKKTKKRKKR